jgi:myo-inositol-1(or 4)-monophosphatase
MKRTYRASKGKGAFRGRYRLRTSTRSPSESIISVGLTSHFSQTETEKTLRIIRALSSHIRGIRIIVSGALEMAWTAESALDGHISIKADPYGTAAGALIIREAGGAVTDLYGADVTLNSTSVVVSNGIIHEDILEICRSAIKDAQP